MLKINGSVKRENKFLVRKITYRGRKNGEIFRTIRERVSIWKKIRIF